MRNKKGSSDESGAALIAVIFISILLVTACAFLLTAVGHNSRNSTDVLAETKAFYAAESGLQAAINVFRNNTDADFKDNPYKYAAAHPDLSAKLTYTAVGTDQQVLVGTNSGYKVNITDPDNSSVSITFSVDGQFLQADGYSWASTRVFGTSPNTTTISYANVASAVHTHPINNTSFGNFQIVSTGTGGTLANLRFRINYRMTAPRAAVRTLTGTISGSTRVATIDASDDYVDDGNTSDIDYVFSLMGKNNIFLCANNAVPCATDNQFTIQLPTPTTTIQNSIPGPIYAKLLPIEPYRLKLQVTGYSRPGNAKKQLEAVIQRNFFNDLSPGAAVSMIGPNADMQGGNSNNFQITGGSVASISVSDPTGLANVMDDPRASNYQPPPVIANPSDLPDWQQSPQAMDALVTQLRQTAINSGTYFGSGQQPTSWGNGNGTGITFCDGSCELTASKQNPGGGILVVTGTLTVTGNSGFNGLMLITGPGGLVLSGGGSSQWNGSVVIAPYDASTMQWQTPHYTVSGGALATDFDTLLVDNSFDAVNGVTDFVLGIAEK